MNRRGLPGHPKAMPDWTAPFHIPKLTDAEFARRRAEYVAKHGYSITIPGLSDIIKIPIEEPMTYEEHTWWKAKQWHKFGPHRLEEVKKQKQKRKDKYLAMLASPRPEVALNAASILTSIDDAQDAIVSLAALGNLARYVAPKVLGKVLRGPTGLLLVTSDLMNLVQSAGMYCMVPMYNKKAGEELARASPKNFKAKLKKRMRSTARIPTQSDWIQGLQTTDSIFGFGLCLGPIVGLAQDIIFASVRTRPGKFVDIKFPVPDFSYWYKAAQKVAKALSVVWSYPFATDDEDILLWIVAAYLAFQQLFEITQEWNPLEMLSTIQDLELKAPTPWHSLTLEVIDEGPVPLDSVVGWPQTTTLWGALPDIIDRTQDVANKNLQGFLRRNKHSWTGFVGGLCAIGAATHSLACLEGEGDVYYDHSMQLKATTTMLKHGYMLDPAQPYAKFELFESFLDDCEQTLWNPTMENILEFCESPWNDVRLLKTSASMP